jgi:hypothetical protein
MGHAMTDNESRSLDVLGIKPVADAISHATKASIDGASAFLGRICLPAAEEFGLLLQDKVRVWRAKNGVAIVAEAQERFDKYQTNPDAHAHPRLVAAVIDHGSWSDDKILQKMWGGLLASSCSGDGRDESNLIFINLLSQLTSLQVRVLAYGCENAEKLVTSTGLIMPKCAFMVDIPTLMSVASTNDVHRLDRELDHLRGLGLINVGFQPHMPTVDVSPSALGLNLVVRSQGFTGSAVDFFGLKSSEQKA